MNKSWNVLSWNIRGINSNNKLLSLRNAIDTSVCSMLCIQETKHESFDLAFIKTFCPSALINLSLRLHWVPRVVLLLFGTARCLWACHGLLIPLLWGSLLFQLSPMRIGISSMFMVLVRASGGWRLAHGY